jgi:RNA polymerase sigma factor (sigma-70 family)
MGEHVDRSVEEPIIDQLGRGDENALTWLLENVVPLTSRLLRRRFGRLTNEDLDEIIAQALFKLWKRRELYDPAKGDLQGWFYVIARNAALDQIRETRRSQAASDLSVLMIDSKDGVSLKLTSEAEIVAKAFTQLNHRERTVVKPLFDSEQNQPTMRELGRKLKISEGAVRALRFRGLRKMRQALAKMGYRLFRREPKDRKAS